MIAPTDLSRIIFRRRVILVEKGGVNPHSMNINMLFKTMESSTMINTFFTSCMKISSGYKCKLVSNISKKLPEYHRCVQTQHTRTRPQEILFQIKMFIVVRWSASRCRVCHTKKSAYCFSLIWSNSEVKLMLRNMAGRKCGPNSKCIVSYIANVQQTNEI